MSFFRLGFFSDFSINGALSASGHSRSGMLNNSDINQECYFGYKCESEICKGPVEEALRLP